MVCFDMKIRSRVKISNLSMFPVSLYDKYDAKILHLVQYQHCIIVYVYIIHNIFSFHVNKRKTMHFEYLDL